MSILTDGDLELGLVTLEGFAERTTSQAYTGSYSLLLRTRKGLPPEGVSFATWPTFTQVTDRVYAARFRYDGDGSLTAPLLVDVDRGDGAFALVATIEAPGAAAWALSDSVTWMATGTEGRLRLRSGPATPALANDVWYVDAVTVDLAEPREVAKWEAVSAMITALKGINGSGYWTDLDDAVYMGYDLDPDKHPEIKRPYLCVWEDKSAFNQQERVIDEVFPFIIAGYVNETHAVSRDAAAYEAAAKLREDIIKALRVDQTLGGTVKIMEFQSTDQPPTQNPMSYRACEVDVTLRLMYDDASLGP